MLEWKDGRIGLFTAGKSSWLPFTMTVTTDKQVVQMTAEELVYNAMIREVMPYFTGSPIPLQFPLQN